MDLDHSIWKSLTGGYRIPYNASVPLRRLAEATKQAEYEPLFSQLWENLHHQGDVGTASYLAVTQLVSVCISKRSLDWNYIGLCVMIENCRLKENNPEIPEEFQNLYFDSLTRFERYLLQNFKNITDESALRLSLALFATLNGQPDLGKAIELLDEDVLGEFLEKY